MCDMCVVGLETLQLLRLFEPFVLFVQPTLEINLIKTEMKAEYCIKVYVLNGLDHLYMYYFESNKHTV
jgi:hypothetical protein